MKLLIYLLGIIGSVGSLVYSFILVRTIILFLFLVL